MKYRQTNINYFIVGKLEKEREKLGISMRAFSKLVGYKNEGNYIQYAKGFRNFGIDVVLRVYKHFDWDLNELKGFDVGKFDVIVTHKTNGYLDKPFCGINTGKTKNVTFWQDVTCEHCLRMKK